MFYLLYHKSSKNEFSLDCMPKLLGAGWQLAGTNNVTTRRSLGTQAILSFSLSDV